MTETWTYRLIDTDGSEVGLVQIARSSIKDGDQVTTADGEAITVLEVYDDKDGQEGGVTATLVIDA